MRLFICFEEKGCFIMTKMLLNELAEIFDGPDNPFQNPETEVKLAKLSIKCDLDKSLPNGPYFVNGVEVIIDNIDSFSNQELSQSNADHIESIMSYPNAVLIL